MERPARPSAAHHIEVCVFDEKHDVGLLFEYAPDGLLAVDAGGRIIQANSQAEELFGYPRGGLRAIAVEDLVPDTVRGVHAAHRARYAQDPQPRRMGAGRELLALRADGTTLPVEITLRSITRAPDDTIVFVGVRDASDRVKSRLERERLESQIDEYRRLDSIGQLAGGVAHDFNNLLTVILGHVDIALSSIPEDDAVVRHHLRVVQDAGVRGADLTRQLLTVGRKDLPRPERLDLNDVVRGVLPMLDRTIGEHIDLRIELTTDALPILADAARMEQVLVNLVANARDALAGGGLIRLRTASATFAPWDRPHEQVDGALLEVTDNGIGMPPETIARAFEPFFTTKPVGTGTGLGLATVHAIARRLGGDARITSTHGEGTTVSVVVPTATGGAPQLSEEVLEDGAAPAPGMGRTVLVIEDDEDVRSVSEHVLASGGYRVLAAKDAVQALSMVVGQAERIEVVVTDVVLPGLSGPELAQALRAAGVRAPVVYCSGYTRGLLSPHHVLDVGTLFLRKPFTREELLGIVGDALTAQRVPHD